MHHLRVQGKETVNDLRSGQCGGQWLFVILLCVLAVAGQAAYKPNWDSLNQYRCPEWFRDAKFGIYMHWGLETVPGKKTGISDGWYARHMYMQTGAPDWGADTYEFHCKHFGHPSEFGFKDFIPLWEADKLDADALAEFYKEVGARYVVMLAAHHDNFDNYDSTYQPWNSVNMGPQRDLVRVWQEAAHRHGLRYGVSSHCARAWDWYEPAHGADVEGPKKDVPYDGNLTEEDGEGTWWEGYDPRELYCPPHAPDQPPTEAYKEKWFKRTKELIDDYHLDVLYFDGGLRYGKWGLRVASHYYNTSLKRNEGKQQAVLTLKHMPSDEPAVRDLERGVSTRLRELPWQTDTTVKAGWFWRKSPPLRLTGPVVIDMLVDVVSKNGNLLLNVGLRPDGTLPEKQRRVLRQVGQWLDVNGEAIFETRPWKTFGEGPTRLKPRGYENAPDEAYTPQDLRFTTRGETLYAIALAWPGDRELIIRSLAEGNDHGVGEVRRVELLGYSGELKWVRGDDGLTVRLPRDKPCKHALALRITPAE